MSNAKKNSDNDNSDTEKSMKQRKREAERVEMSRWGRILDQGGR